MRKLFIFCCWLLFVAIPATALRADEGMWLYNALPKEHLKKQHGFEVTDDWSEHLMLSSVRFNSGGSASFISSND